MCNAWVLKVHRRNLGLTEDGAKRKWQRDFADQQNVRRDQVEALDPNWLASGRMAARQNGFCLSHVSTLNSSNSWYDAPVPVLVKLYDHDHKFACSFFCRYNITPLSLEPLIIIVSPLLFHLCWCLRWGLASLHPDWHPVQPDQLPCPLDDEQVTLIYYHSCHVMYVVFSFPAVCVVATFFWKK